MREGFHPQKELIMSKRSNGEGTIVQRNDGRWQVSLQIEGVRRTAYARTKREARKLLLSIREQATLTGALPNPSGKTLGLLIETWLSSAPNLKQTTINSYRGFFNLYVLPTLGNTRLERITPDRIQHLYASLKPSIAERIHRLLHRAFAVAVQWNWLAENPCDRVIRPSYHPEKRQMWSSFETQKFLLESTDHWLYPLWVLLISSGLRIGEALALHWGDVELGTTINVVGTLHRLEGEYVVGEPKTRNARRKIILPSLAVDALKRQKAQQDMWRLEADSWSSSDFVFTGKTGKPLGRCTPEVALRRECIRLGLTPVTPHGLRHLHASLLIDRGVPLPIVAARLGHANPEITLRLYAHALPNHDHQAAQAIGKALGDAGSK